MKYYIKIVSKEMDTTRFYACLKIMLDYINYRTINDRKNRKDIKCTQEKE